MKTGVLLAILLPAVVLLSGCPFASSSDCSPGSTKACTCANDAAGVATCSDTGSYGACFCNTSGDGGTADGGGGCPNGGQLCGSRCVDTTSDPLNCGACGGACGTGQVCQTSTCTDWGNCNQNPCVGLTYCDTSSGQCLPGCSQDNQCGAGEICDTGTHSCVCNNGYTRCSGACTDTQTDTAHCGSCANACGAQQTCSGGACQCTGALTDCGAGAGCVDLTSDPNHCGSCSRACPASASCQASACVCPQGQQICGDFCVDTSTDAANCGGCGSPCPQGDACQNSVCVAPPDCRTDGCTGFTWCDTTTGQCMSGCAQNSQCRTDQVCDTTTHACVCPQGLTECNGVCADTTSDNANCGGCNQPCGNGQTCVNSVCTSAPAACVNYSGTGRLASCGSSTPCQSSSLQCTNLGFASVCADQTPCSTSPTSQCCGTGEFCGTDASPFGSIGVVFCCVPGEAINDGLGGTCGDAGLDIGCQSNADCPLAWGIPYCLKTLTNPKCVACLQNTDCQSGQVCDTTKGTCVDCLATRDCAGGMVCDTSTNKCVECLSNGDCSGSTPVCDTATNTCVTCMSDTDCTNVATPHCDTTTHTCAQCVQNTDCGGTTPYCAGGTCAVCPSGETCQTMADGVRGCYPNPAYPFDYCPTITTCTAPDVCDNPTGGTKFCVSPCQ